jgi:hypothetical protein
MKTTFKKKEQSKAWSEKAGNILLYDQHFKEKKH